MEITLKAVSKTSKSTISECFVDNKHECHILEDMDRGLRTGLPTTGKLFGITAIPAGRYQVIVNASPRFKRDLPLLLNVPGYAGIRIHPGNTADDTEGCLLPGEYRPLTSNDFVYNSRKEFDELFTKIKAALAKKEKVWITIQR